MFFYVGVHFSPFVMARGRRGEKKTSRRCEKMRKRIRAMGVQLAFIVRAGCSITYERVRRRRSISPRRRPVEARKSFIFRIPVALSSPAISAKFHPFSGGTFLESALGENPQPRKPVGNFVHFTYRDIKVMSYEIDCHHKIVSSRFCGRRGMARVLTPPPVLGSAKQMCRPLAFIPRGTIDRVDIANVRD